MSVLREAPYYSYLCNLWLNRCNLCYFGLLFSLLRRADDQSGTALVHLARRRAYDSHSAMRAQPLGQRAALYRGVAGMSGLRPSPGAALATPLPSQGKAL